MPVLRCRAKVNSSWNGQRVVECLARSDPQSVQDLREPLKARDVETKTRTEPHEMQQQVPQDLCRRDCAEALSEDLRASAPAAVSTRRRVAANRSSRISVRIAVSVTAECDGGSAFFGLAISFGPAKVVSLRDSHAGRAIDRAIPRDHVATIELARHHAFGRTRAETATRGQVPRH